MPGVCDMLQNDMAGSIILGLMPDGSINNATLIII